MSTPQSPNASLKSPAAAVNVEDQSILAAPTVLEPTSMFPDIPFTGPVASALLSGIVEPVAAELGSQQTEEAISPSASLVGQRLSPSVSPNASAVMHRVDDRLSLSWNPASRAGLIRMIQWVHAHVHRGRRARMLRIVTRLHRAARDGSYREDPAAEDLFYTVVTAVHRPEEIRHLELNQAILNAADWLDGRRRMLSVPAPLRLEPLFNATLAQTPSGVSTQTPTQTPSSPSASSDVSRMSHPEDWTELSLSAGSSSESESESETETETDAQTDSSSSGTESEASSSSMNDFDVIEREAVRLARGVMVRQETPHPSMMSNMAQAQLNILTLRMDALSTGLQQTHARHFEARTRAVRELEDLVWALRHNQLNQWSNPTLIEAATQVRAHLERLHRLNSQIQGIRAELTEASESLERLTAARGARR